MKLLRLSFAISKGVVMGVGVGFTTILAILSLSIKYGAMTEAKVDLPTLTSGYWVYVWTISLLVFFVGTLIMGISQSYKLVKAYKEKRKGI